MVSQQYNVFVLSLGALQGLLLSIFLFRKRQVEPAMLFLLLYLLILLLQVAMKIASKTWLIHHVNFLYWVAYTLPFIYGPLLYLFLKHLLQQKSQFSSKTALHFLPFFLIAGAELSSRFLSHIVLPVSAYLFWGAAQISLIIYHWAGWQLLNRLEFGTNQALVWLRQFTRASFFTTLILTLTLFSLYILYPHYTEIRWLFAAATLFIYWVSYNALSHPEFFNSKPIEPINGKAQTPKYTNSTLPLSEIDRILADLNALMQQKRPYLNPELTIDDLATQVNTNRHNLSQALNGHLQKNYFDYLNAYRVKAAQAMLANPELEHLKIAAIAYEAGFNSLSTFNAVFKKQTGQKPSDFRRF